MLVTFGNQEILPLSLNFLSRAIAQILHILLPTMLQFLKLGGGGRGRATSLAPCMPLRVPLEQEVSLVVSRSKMGAWGDYAPTLFFGPN